MTTRQTGIDRFPPPLTYRLVTDHLGSPRLVINMSDGAPNTALEQVIAFIRDRVGGRDVALDKRLLEDLGIDGADASELLEEFAERFHVDMSGFRPADYFGPEAGFSPLALLYYRLLRRLPKTEPLYVRDLVSTVEAGRWSKAVK